MCQAVGTALRCRTPATAAMPAPAMTRPPSAPRLISIQLPSSVDVLEEGRRDDVAGLGVGRFEGAGRRREGQACETCHEGGRGQAGERAAGHDCSPVPGWWVVLLAFDDGPEAGALTSGAPPQIGGATPLDAGLDLPGKPRDTRRRALHSENVGAAEWGEAARIAGRAREQELLRKVVGGSVQGIPCTVLVHGEAGVGKTRLVTSVADRSRAAGHTVLWARCLRFGAESSPYLPFISAFEGLQGRGPDARGRGPRAAVRRQRRHRHPHPGAARDRPRRRPAGRGRPRPPGGRRPAVGRRVLAGRAGLPDRRLAEAAGGAAGDLPRRGPPRRARAAQLARRHAPDARGRRAAAVAAERRRDRAAAHLPVGCHPAARARRGRLAAVGRQRVPHRAARARRRPGRGVAARGHPGRAPARAAVPLAQPEPAGTRRHPGARGGRPAGGPRGADRRGGWCRGRRRAARDGGGRGHADRPQRAGVVPAPAALRRALRDAAPGRGARPARGVRDRAVAPGPAGHPVPR